MYRVTVPEWLYHDFSHTPDLLKIGTARLISGSDLTKRSTVTPACSIHSFLFPS
jgi:hypothetical protein